jgi:hypothetical protein
MADAAPTFDAWLARLRDLAQADGVEWLIAREPDTHRESFAKGLTPDEELAALKDMSEWRGCGCGGG